MAASKQNKTPAKPPRTTKPAVPDAGADFMTSMQELDTVLSDHGFQGAHLTRKGPQTRAFVPSGPVGVAAEGLAELMDKLHPTLVKIGKRLKDSPVRLNSVTLSVGVVALEFGINYDSPTE